MSKAVFDELLRYTMEPCCATFVLLIQTAKGDDAAYAVGPAVRLPCKYVPIWNF